VNNAGTLVIQKQ